MPIQFYAEDPSDIESSAEADDRVERHLRALGFGVWVCGLRFRAFGLGLKVWGLSFKA